jgi:hypothetical protein
MRREASIDLGGTDDAWTMPDLLSVRPAVFDTGPLTTDVIGSVKRGQHSPLWWALRLGLVRAFAAHHVWAEVPRILRKRAARDGLSPTWSECGGTSMCR